MKKVIFVISLLLIIIVVTLYFYMNNNHELKIPKRPGNVPITAIWDGGVDGGNWVDCKVVDSTKNLFYCTVFEDFGGEIIFEGTMRLNGKTTNLKQLKYLLGFYSGDEIYLKDKRTLKEVVAPDSLSYEEKVKLSPDN